MQQKGPAGFRKHNNLLILEVSFKVSNKGIMTYREYILFFFFKACTQASKVKSIVSYCYQDRKRVTSVLLLTSAYQTHNPFLTLACNSLSWGTVAIIFMAITLIRGKHTDGVVSQTHELRIKVSSLPELVMVCKANALKSCSLSRPNFVSQTFALLLSATDTK